MRRLLAAAAAACFLLPAAGAQATSGKLSPVLVLENGRVHVKRERFLGPTTLPGATRAPTHPRATAAAKKKAPRGRATRLALDGLLAQGAIDQPTRDARQASLRQALRTYTALTGTRKLELGAVIDNGDAISDAGQLTASRLNAVFATLEANASWWTDGSVPKPGARISVDGSPVIWQYYAGQGIQLQMLANFGKVNALWQGKRTTALRALIDQLMPLAADRGGSPAFEYYFKFGGGTPPWTSSISQGTAVQSLARAGQLLGDANLSMFSLAALAAFEQPPPNGVRLDTPTGPFYLIYSFNPKLLVINAHLQALVGLYDVAQLTGDQRALGLFQQGDAEAQAVLPSYDTGAWSMYDQSHESDLSYHDLVTTFLQNLCKRTSTPVYCETVTRFKSYKKTPPTSAPVTHTIRTGKLAKLTFTVDKISRVGVTVLDQNGTTIFATSAVVGRGDHFYNWSRPAAAGLYTLRIAPTDLAGNRGEPAEGQLRILPASKKRAGS
ncbi:MAG TPA: D-glucuronyl C5-epimerase family protein [Thermoleophilaceae bacterium]